MAVARSRKLEDALARIARVRADPLADNADEELRRGLAHSSPHVVAAAAGIIADCGMDGFDALLVSAFDLFMRNPEKSDKGCTAKAALADALYQTDRPAENVFLRGIHHVQLEPVFGGKADTAPRLRGICALGLVRMSYPDVLAELAELLADPEAEARRAAALAIEYREADSGLPLLQLKLLAGDPDADVVGRCLRALLRIGRESSLPFLGRLVRTAGAETREAVALALGESRLPGALPRLRELWERSEEAELRRTALLAIATLRHDEALEFLLSLIAEAPGPDARDAIGALAIYADDPELRRQVRETAERREDLDLREAVERAF